MAGVQKGTPLVALDVVRGPGQWIVFRIRDANTAKEAPLDGWAIYRLGLIAVIGLWLLLRLLRKQTVWMGALFQGLIGAMTIYALVSATSAVWSVNGPWTLYKSVEYLIDMMLMAAILVTLHSLKDYETLFNWNWILTGLLIASAWVGAVIWPEEALDAASAAACWGCGSPACIPAKGRTGWATSAPFWASFVSREFCR